MQITSTVSEGLRREFKVVIAQTDLNDRLTGKLEEMKPRLHLKGFRPGKAPVSFLKKTYGKSMMNEIVEAAVNEFEPEGHYRQRAQAGDTAKGRSGQRVPAGCRRKVRLGVYGQSRLDA